MSGVANPACSGGHFALQARFVTSPNCARLVFPPFYFVLVSQYERGFKPRLQGGAVNMSGVANPACSMGAVCNMSGVSNPGVNMSGVSNPEVNVSGVANLGL